jgi:hypothetical protein
MTIVLPSDQGILRYGDIDLTDVGKITLGAAVAPAYFSGGTVEFVLDREDGPVIGTAELEVNLTDIGFKELPVEIKPTEGKHDLILRFKCKDASKIFGGVATLEFGKRK